MRAPAQRDYDYLVVGAGTAGCAVAARLSESGRYTVALLEAGGEDKGFWFRAPLGYGKLYGDPSCNWLYTSEPEPEWRGATSAQPRGKVLGGTGSINGMLQLRGQREDFNQWHAMGNEGWAYDEVLPFFRKAEDNELGANAFRGVGGPMRVSKMPAHELADAFVEAAVQAGYPRNDDFNGASQEGFGYNQLTTRNGERCSTAAAYLKPARARKNLTVLTRATARKINFEGNTATGVEVSLGGAAPVRLTARKEVIICCGTFNSPQLLQVSGVGPRALLEQHGIPVVAELPGVGENLQDHIGTGITYRCTRPITINDRVNNPLRKLAMGLRYVLFRSGLMATNANYAGGCVRTNPSLAAPDVNLAVALWARSLNGRSLKSELQPFSAFTIPFFLFHPDSRGSVRIKSADIATPPEIRFNFFESGRDQDTAVASLKIIRRIMAMPAMAPYIREEMQPGPGIGSKDELLQYCRSHMRSIHHATSSCKMGTDAMAVVDARLRVRDTHRLRVIDSAIMPRIVGANPNAATVMIAEKGSAMVLEDAGRQHPQEPAGRTARQG